MIHDKRGSAVPWLLLVLLVVAIFGRVVSHDFTNWDDPSLIIRNTHVNPPTISGLLSSWAQPHEGMFIPLTYNVWWVLSVVGRYLGGRLPEGGIPPWPFHLASLLVHAANAVLVMLILRRAAAKWAAFAGAAIFAIHPIQVEAVGWATGMKDLFSSFLAFSSIIALLRSAESFRDGRNTAGHLSYSVGLILCFLGTLAKPGILGVPLIAAALDACFISGFRRSVLWRMLGLLMVTAPSAYWTSQIQHIEGYHDNLALEFRPLIALHALGFYASKVLYPANFAIDYGLRPLVVVTSWKHIAFAVVPALALLPVLLLRPHRRALLLTYFIFIAGVFPVLGLVPFGFQFYSTVADRYAYVSMLGCAILAAYAFERLRPRFAVTAGLAIVVMLGMQASGYLRVWKSSITLMADCIRVNPAATVAYNNIGAAIVPIANLGDKKLFGEKGVKPDWAIPEATSEHLLEIADSMYAQQLAVRAEYPLPLKNMIWLRGCRERYAEAAALGEMTYRAYEMNKWMLAPEVVSAHEMAWLYTAMKNPERAAYWMTLHLSQCGPVDGATHELMTRMAELATGESRPATTQPSVSE